ncbi:endonuclease [Polaribacter cellanae]|uniref:Endonuclease n=1 Tax=Polaribacter cellanae TaxID=2818493 RepID=A0A975CPS6_9FLAO|nr:endonuclease [Polaribacter cellanae]QTE23002.1 endonuclease [Polaribacter cellanae]
MIRKIIPLFAFLLFASSIFSQESYYSDVNLKLTGISLKEELATKIISTHTQFLFYDQIWDASKITDVNPENNTQVLLIYGYENGTDSDVTNDRVREIDKNGGAPGEWNREHVFSRSLGVPNLGTSGPGSDAHHLRPADAQRNSSRNNRKFTAGNGNSAAQANTGWYPGDEWKGDVARMVMYLYVRYGNRCLPTNVGFGDNLATPDDMIDLFLQWNVEDPVSDFERQRNIYHENTSNQNAQGNRNPFIDNPILATRIWGGAKAEDTWGIYTNNDTQPPTMPTNVVVNNVTTFSVDVSWNAATDNTAVTSYDVFVDGNLRKNTTNTNTTITGLNSDTSYTIAILAKDIAENKSTKTTPVNTRTLVDNEAPTIPTNIVIGNETGNTFKITWNASTDNTAVTGYDVFINDAFLETTTATTSTVTNLAISTTYKVQVLAKDAVGNKSALSTPINATTTDGVTTTANELFFSEYLEGSSNNKALEIVNLTNVDIDLGAYSIKRQSNGGLNGAEWAGEISLSGKIIKSKDVFVIVNEASGEHTASKSQFARDAGDYLISIADSIRVHDGDTNFGEPINFNGNDPVGLFKNNVLIDIIGTYNGGTSNNFGKDKTLRRKSGVTQPNTAFDLNNEWDIFPKDTADDFGKYYNVLSTENFYLENLHFYPNPVENIINIEKTGNYKIESLSIYNVLGKKITTIKTISNKINLSFLSKGIYILKFEVDNKLYATKFIKK